MTTQEINVSIALLLGWVPNQNPNFKRDMEKTWKSPSGGLSFLPDYCGSIFAAWEIVEFVSHQFTLQRLEKSKKWICTMNEWGRDGSVADTAPMAICLAFLKLNAGN